MLGALNLLNIIHLIFLLFHRVSSIYRVTSKSIYNLTFNIYNKTNSTFRLCTISHLQSINHRYRQTEAPLLAPLPPSAQLVKSRLKEIMTIEYPIV